MSCDIDDHITAKYDIKKRIGKGVRASICFVEILVYIPHQWLGNKSMYVSLGSTLM